MSTSAPPSIWESRRVAVVGASDRGSSMGGRVVRNLLRHGFTGEVHPVHPRAETVAGLTASRSVRDLDDVDLAIVLVPGPAVPDAVAECAAAGVQNVVVGASGFSETGPVGTAVEAGLAAVLRDAGCRLWGPNTIGVADLATGLVATFSPGLDTPGLFTGDGDLAVVSQSGGLAYGVAGLAAEAGLPVRWIATTGNEGDVTAGEVVADLAERSDCRAVLAVLETPPRADDLARFSAADVIVLPIAVSDAGVRHSVTAVRSAWRDATAVADVATVAADLPELLNRAGAAVDPAPESVGAGGRGPRIVVVTTSGGAGILAADAVARHDARLADLSDATRAALADRLPAYASIGNPLDVTATVITDPGLFTESLTIVADDPGVDAVLVCLCVLAEEQAVLAAETIAAVHRRGTPVAVARTGATAHAPSLAKRLADAGAAVHPEPGSAVLALLTRHVHD